MLISEAQANLDDAIEQYARGKYDTTAEQEAIHALVANEPCVISRCSYHNQVALRIAGAVNRGEGDFATLCLAFGRSKAFGTPEEHIRNYVLDALVGVNAQGRALLAEAALHFSPNREMEAA